MKSSANALYAIAHAKFGKRLKKNNYDEMLSLASVVDVAGYLRKKTDYGEALTNVKDGAIHRGHLEELLRGHAAENTAYIMTFGSFVGMSIDELIERRNETGELLKFFRLYNAGRPEEYVFVMPENQKNYKGISISALAQARSVEEVISSVKSPSLYQKIKTVPIGSNVDYTAIEAMFSEYLLEKADELAKNLSKKDRKEYDRVLGIKCELNNVERIYRMKRFGYSDPVLIKSLLLKKSCYIDNDKLDKMIMASSADEVLEIFRTTYYRKDADSFEFSNIDNYLKSICYKNIKQIFRFSTCPIVSVLGYLLLSDYELANIVQIVEGVRYNIPREDIRKLLIGYEEA